MATGEKLKIALFYYTQTGQALAIARKVCDSLEDSDIQIITKEIIPEKPYPFPWSYREFFQVFPESRLGIPCRLKPIDLADIEDADLVMIAGQTWFLSLSVPLHGFFQDEAIRAYLKGRPVIVINGCRNMWVTAQQKTRKYLHAANAKYVGFIELQDRASNLVGVFTILRWLIHNKKEATRFLPAAGVSLDEINDASRFGAIIQQALRNRDFHSLQAKLMEKQAVTFTPSVYFIEKNGAKMWEKWAQFIIKKGGYQSPNREPYLRLFKYYLFIILYIVSPFGLLFFYLAYPFLKSSLDKARREMCYQLDWSEQHNIKIN